MLAAKTDQPYSQATPTLDGVRFARICHSICEKQTVLAIYKVFDSTQDSFIKEGLLGCIMRKNLRKCEVMILFAQAMFGILEGV